MDINRILSSLDQGILICNNQGRIVYFNNKYAEYLGQRLEDVKKHYQKEYRPNAIALEVLRTKTAVEGIIKKEDEKSYYASVYPIMDEESIIGTISIVTSIAQKHNSSQKKRLNLAERVRQFEREEIELTVEVNGGGTEGKRKAAKELGISLATLYNKLKF